MEQNHQACLIFNYCELFNHTHKVLPVIFKRLLRGLGDYADADMFLLTIGNTSDAENFNNSILSISRHFLFVIELLVAQYIGKRKSGEIVSKFLKDISSPYANDRVGRRWDIIKNLF